MAQTRGRLEEALQRIAELEAALDRQEGDMLDLIAENEELRTELGHVLDAREQELRIRYGLHLRVAS